MAQITIYTKPTCIFCLRAKQLLMSKGAAFEEIDLFSEPERMAEMLSLSGGARTVPQIFIGDVHIGGCDDLFALDARGHLDPMLAE